MYSAFIRPILEYASPVWCNATQRDLDKLESVNLSALRCICGAELGTSHDALYKDTGINSLRNRQITSQLVNAFDAKRETRLCRLGGENFVSIRLANRYGLRTTTKLRPIPCHTESYKSFFLPSSVQLLNNIMVSKPNILSLENHNIFKSNIYIKTNY